MLCISFVCSKILLKNKEKNKWTKYSTQEVGKRAKEKHKTNEKEECDDDDDDKIN